MTDLSRITKNGKAMYLAYDQGLEHGPSDLPEKSVSPAYILDLAVQGEFTALILQKGMAEKYYKPYKEKIPLILKLNGKTRLYEGDAFSPQICSVQEAIELGASAVGYTIYIGSKREAEMFEQFGKIQEEAHRDGLPVIAWVYPRGEKIKDDKNPEITAYAARVALELGADIAKIKYCGREECFKKAVEAAGKTKVVLSGGVKTDKPKEFYEIVKNVMSAGAIGVAVGRNVWQRENALEVSQKLKEIIFSNK